MAGRLRNMALYLGLVEDEDEDAYYEESGDYAEAVAEPVAIRASRDRASRAPVVAPPAARRPPAPEVGRRVVVDAPPHADPYRITTVQPRTYNEARTIGEHFREGVPVIINLTEMDDSDAKRLVDFAAGLIFGLHGSIERVTNKVFLLSPSNVEVSAEDKARIAESGFFNQS